jgi:hypothetical protein
VVYLSEKGNCPSLPELMAELPNHLSRHEASVEPQPGSLAVTVTDLGRSFRVFVNGQVRDFEDPGRNCLERAATATVFIALVLEPPSLIAPPPVPPPVVIPPPPPMVMPPPPSLPPPPPPKVKPSYLRLETNFTVGTSVGYVMSGTPVDVAYRTNYDTQQYERVVIQASGAAYEPLHFTLGFFGRVQRLLSVGLVARLGLPVLNTVGVTMNPALGTERKKSNADFAVLAKLRVMFGEKRVHPFLTAGVGGGWINHLHDLDSGGNFYYQPYVDAQTANYYSPGIAPDGAPVNVVCGYPCKDTTTMGYFLTSLSAGLAVDVVQRPTHRLRLLAEVEMQAASLPTYGLNFDFRLGLEAAYY